jgi:tetratricopeptide (TPR) repeat protein
MSLTRQSFSAARIGFSIAQGGVMSRNQRARRKEKHFKQQRDARLLRPSKSAIWTEACDHADDLIDKELWSEAREVLEAVDRSHPGANCVLDRLAEVYDELGETECLAAVNSRRKSNPTLNEVVQELIDIQDRFDDDQQSHVEPALRDVVIMDFKIDYDPVNVPRSPQIQEWAEDGYDALQQKKGREAEVLFKKCVEAAGEAPDFMNNLAVACAMQGRYAESHELARAMHAKWPEYFFGRIYMANTATLEGRFDVAEQYLRPLVMQQRFHITEFRALATSHIQLEIERHRLDAAQSWFDLWKSVEPDHHDLNVFQQRMKARSIPNRILSLLKGLRR